MNSKEQILSLAKNYQGLFKQRKVILPFQEFLALVAKNPRKMIRNSPQYIADAFDHFGSYKKKDGTRRFKLFDLGTERGVPIVGGEQVQDEIYTSLKAFIQQGIANKLIFLHGPNGSAKTSTLDAIAHGLQHYSEAEEGAIYTFNWIFSTEKSSMPKIKGESGTIGFSTRGDQKSNEVESYALLDESLIASKIVSEFRENPLFLIPMPEREKMIRSYLAEKEGKRPEDVEVPQHILLAGLSKRNQLILENLLAAYEGDLEKVYRHVQVERFFFSKQYRIGISTVEPQMSIDAQEKLLTMDKNIANLPAFLHNIRFHETHGELVEANRGILEFSDLLKRPLETFKYLLSTVEKGTLSLPSSVAYLDTVFFATANEKHLDSFKTLPDFSSFRGRFELVTVPYILSLTEEMKIYERDVEILNRSRRVAPHALEMLCLWAVMTRLKQPDPEYFEGPHRGLIMKLDPLSKAKLYDNKRLFPTFLPAEESVLKTLRNRVLTESFGTVIYEGRFGASPREIRAALYRAADDSRHATVTPMAIFDELERIIKDRTSYEFLQFEPRHHFHDANYFIRCIKEEFAQQFEEEALRAMSLVEEHEHEKLLARYIENVVAELKREKLYNPKTEGYDTPSQQLMRDIEKIIGVSNSVERHREGLLSRIASFKIENPNGDIDFTVIFHDLYRKMKDHYYEEQSKQVEANFKVMLQLGSDEQQQLKQKDIELAEHTFKELEKKFGYDPVSAKECVKFLLSFKRNAKK